ncbi:MAG: hypothetical protein K2O89_04195 [Clostridia bacterium]|nr:hypothetical protein [Clostridia bacterium]
MYRLLIRKIRRDETVSDEEKATRCVNVMDFWIKNGKKYRKILKNLEKDDDGSVEDYFRYLGYWLKFKLLCEGKEINLGNALPFDLEELNEFIASVKLLANE